MSSLLSKPALSLVLAEMAADRALAAATGRRLAVTVAVVDDGGHLLVLKRMEQVGPAGPVTATAKARTAALFRRTTAQLAEAVAAGASGLLSISEALPLAGGIPIVVDDVVIGAVGVGGATPDEDAAVAEEACCALAAFLRPSADR
ncbi:glycolate utilization protein [Rhizobium rhizogenes]|uniref:GlcG protein n=1 Tax=Rhizobium rhizogenes (strain K84 / ATCC BAA-868) TaxID=311403 RepID=B9JML8_RHIR8|nr:MULTISPECIES: heme-binding protein [Rhizobium]ACM28799.1 conserved hypothetical protein [Rhizobium rhizogenes K84]OCJ18940.1 glycolate utilization protein [Agrobacterium sp. B131/95]EJK88095.1 putative protein, possibly involved in utilization of glycolate and propanediol [Rhizobium sp. AP16]NTI24470.1 glycolate utilization protein [Rhizobium rhizogenes]NTI43790.1 glycolate utilization protein [Rhizobium rhizogenes]